MAGGSTSSPDGWKRLWTSTLKQVRSVLSRSLRRAMKRGLVERNVVDLCPAPKGRPGRPSKSLTLQQASDVLDKTRRHHMHAYIVVSLLVGLRPEEVRALRWSRVHLAEDGGEVPHVEVWRSVRVGGDVKTRKSRRTLAISGYVVAVLKVTVRTRRRRPSRRARAGRTMTSSSPRASGPNRTHTTCGGCSGTP
jgi:integrase